MGLLYRRPVIVLLMPTNLILGSYTVLAVITFVGNQENLASREAALFALAANLVMLLAAIISIMITVPKGKSTERS